MSNMFHSELYKSSQYYKFKLTLLGKLRQSALF